MRLQGQQGPLAVRVYRRLFAAQVIALLGTGLTTIALALLAYDLAGDRAGAVLGIALALKMLAYVFVAPVVAGVASQLPRRPLLVTLDVLRALTVAAMPFVTAVWQVYALIVVLNACSAGFTPTFQSVIPEVLPEERAYTRALSLSRLAYELENLGSPALAAILLSFVGYSTLFTMNGAAFLLSAGLVLSVALPATSARHAAAGAWTRVTQGTRRYLATPRLRGLLALNLAAAAASAMVIVNTVVYVRDMLGQDETGVAYAMMAAGAGSMAMALLLPRLLERVPERLAMLVGGGLLSAALALGAVLQPGFSGLLALWLLVGAGSSLVQTPSGRLLRRSSRVPDRPAYFAAHFALSHACWLLAYPLAGWLGGATTFSVVFGALAALVFASTIIGALVWPAIDSEVIEHLHEEHEHCHLHVHDAHHQHEHEGWERPEPHVHAHRHAPLRHRHGFAIDLHHRRWPA